MMLTRGGLIIVASACAALSCLPQAAAQTPEQPHHHVRLYIPPDCGLDSLALERMLTQALPTTRWEISAMSEHKRFKEMLLMAQEAATTDALTLVAWLEADGSRLHLYAPHQDDVKLRLSSRALTPALRGTAARQLTFILQQLLPSIPSAKAQHTASASPKPSETLPPQASTPPSPASPASPDSPHLPAPVSAHVSAGVGLLVYSSAPTIRYIFHARATLFTLTYLGVGLYADWAPQVEVGGLDHIAALSHRAIALDLAHRWIMRSGELVLSLAIGAEHTQGEVRSFEDRAISRWAAIAVPSLKWRHKLTEHVDAQVGLMARINPRAQLYDYGPGASQVVPRWRIAPALTLGVNAHWP